MAARMVLLVRIDEWKNQSDIHTSDLTQPCERSAAGRLLTETQSSMSVSVLIDGSLELICPSVIACS